MKGTTKVGTAALAAIVGYALLTSVNWQAFPGIDKAPLRNRVTPSTEDGRWVRLIGTWSDEGPANITITAGDNVSPPNCDVGVCPTNPYNTLIQVKRGQQVIFSVQSKTYKGGATCVILLSGESWGSKLPEGARVDNSAGRLRWAHDR
jgi:hypothetical protein